MLHVGSLLVTLFLLYCVLDVILTDTALIRNLPKLVWLLLVVVIPPIGGLAWFVAGRPETAGLAPGSQSSRRPEGYRYSTRGNPVHPHPSTRRPGGPPPPRRTTGPKGPDDDPAFLEELERRLRRPDEDADTDR